LMHVQHAQHVTLHVGAELVECDDLRRDSTDSVTALWRL
jgi:hypothetical protein